VNYSEEYTLISGKIEFQNIETGFWSIMDGERKYRITNMPEELKKNGLNIAAVVEIIEEEMSVFMSGIPVIIVDFKLLK